MNKNNKSLPFLELTQDIVFKRFFSQNKEALISLLKNFLPLKSDIQDITILNTSKPTTISTSFEKTKNIQENRFEEAKEATNNQLKTEKTQNTEENSFKSTEDNKLKNQRIEENTLQTEATFKSNKSSSLEQGLKNLNPDFQAKSYESPLREESLKDLDFKQTAFYPLQIDKKQIVLDLRVKLATGENINVEMQTVRHKDFLKRILFYWSKLYSHDLERGEDYSKIKPAYSLIFTTFPVLDLRIKDFMSSFSIRRDKKPHELLNEDLKIVIVELSKLDKLYDETFDLKEKWCYILRESGKITREEYEILSKDEEMKMALDHLEELSRDEQLRQEAFTRKINEVAYGLDRAGLIEEGLQKGRVEGLQEGLQKGLYKVALNMLRGGFEEATISKITGLSKDEIKELKLKMQ